MGQTPETEDAVTSNALNVYALSERFNFPLSKQNYALWYDYAAGTNPGLTQDINRHIEKGLPFTPDILSRMVENHLETDLTDALSTVQVQTRTLIRDVLAGVSQASDSSSAYETTLNTYSAGLANVTSVKQVHTIIAALLRDTRAMARENQELQKEFNRAKTQSELLSRKLEQVELAASTDALTGLFNRRAFDRSILDLIHGFEQTGEPASVIVLDIDFFKKFNDTYGHQVGDEVLKTVGRTIKRGVKGKDIPTRYGGEEFVILLPETPLKQACIVAEQLRIRIAITPLKTEAGDREIQKITVSLGVAATRPGDTPTSLVERADQALYIAKQSGRNNTKSETDL